MKAVTDTLEHIFTIDRLQKTAEAIGSAAPGVDGMSPKRYRDDPDALSELRDEILSGRYAPLPLKRIELPKENGETRPIAISAARDRIVQKLLATALTERLDPLFSDRSYGYRPDKGTLRAIHRCRDILQRGYGLVYRTDIDDFFERIDHGKLLELLRRHISDERIVDLIALFLANGSFRSFDYLEHEEGVHQGDPLSPLLSNLYLDRMDRWLEKRHVEFVRFADDFTLFFKHRETRDDLVPKLADWLYRELGLELESSKSHPASVWKEGFTFLGVRFHREHLLIDNERLQKKVSKLYEMARNSTDTERYIAEINAFVEGLQRYYLEIVTWESPQFAHLEQAFADSVARRIARAFAEEEIRYKKEARALLQPLQPLIRLSKTDRKRFIDGIVDRAKALAAKGGKETPQIPASAKSALGRKRQETAKNMATESTLVVDGFGAFLGISKGKSVVLKRKGKKVRSLPVKSCRRILITTDKCSLSGALIHTCSRRGIPIDFVDGDNTPYAALYGERHASTPLAIRQLEAHADQAHRLELARAFLKSKIKNQRNYLKYLDKHHHDATEHIRRISVIDDRLADAGSIDELMGIEGSVASLYWDALGRIVAEKVRFEARIARGATDPVNSALNYGYAILYGEVQKALVHAGLALHISFLHAPDGGKPTLVYDLIEEFRTFVVDRSVFSMINREEPIETEPKSGKLTRESRRLVAQNVVERLGSYTRYRKESHRLSRVIEEQAYRLARHLEGGKKYKGFVGRY